MACRVGSSLRRPWTEAPCSSSSSSTRPSSALLPRAPAPLRLRHPQRLILQRYSSAPAHEENKGEQSTAGHATTTLPPPSDIDREHLAVSAGPVTKSDLKKAGVLDDVISAEYKVSASGKLIRRRIPLATPTLEEFRKLKSRTPTLAHLRGQGKWAYKQARQDATYRKTFDEVSAALGVAQLKSLARTAGLPVAPNAKKADVLHSLLEDQLGLVSPERRMQKEKAERMDRRIPVTRTEMFLLLVNGGHSLGALATQTGASFTPDARTSEGQEPEYAIVASGNEQTVGSRVDERLERFRNSIQTVVMPLQVPVEALHLAVVGTISARTRTAIEKVAPSSPEDVPSIRLTALSDYDVSLARLQLVSHQAELFETPSALASYAQPSPLDPAHNDEVLQDSLQHFAFLPTSIPSVTPWMTGVMLGGEEMPAFRLSRVREAGKGSGHNDLGKSFVGLDWLSSQRPPLSLQPADNWQWLHERLDLSQARDCVPSLPFRAARAVATDTHTLSIGSLIFPGDTTSDDSSIALLERLLNPPLSGYWTLDTAFEWLRSRPVQQAGEEVAARSRNQRSPLWISDHLPHVPVDGTGTISSRMAQVLDTDKPAQEHEMIRLVYRMERSRNPVQDPVEGGLNWKLHLDIKENFVVKDTRRSGSGRGEDTAGSSATPAGEASHDDQIAADKSAGSTLKKSMHVYSIDSAYWSAERKVNVLCPDVLQDLQLCSGVQVPIDLRAIDESDVLRSYLTKLGKQVERALVTSALDGERDSTGEDEVQDQTQHHLHPRHGRVPVPLPHKSRSIAIPPLTISLPRGTTEGDRTADAVLYLETTARISQTSYPLLRRHSNRLAEGEAQGEEGRLVTETSISHVYTAAKTTSRVEWSSTPSTQQDGTETGPDAPTDVIAKEEEQQAHSQSAWQRRLESIQALLRLDE